MATPRCLVRPAGQRTGLTLLELLVVIGIVAVLVGLLLAGVQRAREAAAATACKNNLRQLVVAATHYDTAIGQLPPGYLGPRTRNSSFANAQMTGVIPFLLPYLEQDALYRLIAPASVLNPAATGPGWYTAPGTPALVAARTIVPGLRCPSDPDAGPDAEDVLVAMHFGHRASGRSSSAVVIGFLTDREAHVPAGRPLARTNYAGVGGTGTGDAPLFRLYEGVFANRSSRSLTHVASLDGTSNTLMFGETRPGRNPSRKPYFAGHSWFGVGALPTTFGLGPADKPEMWQFSSHHPAGVHFAFCDGSVRALAFDDSRRLRSPGWYFLQRLAGVADGETAKVDP